MISINGEDGEVRFEGHLVDLLSEFATIAMSLAEEMKGGDVSPDKDFSKKAFASTVMTMFQNDKTGIIRPAIEKAVEVYGIYGRIIEDQIECIEKSIKKRYRR